MRAQGVRNLLLLVAAAAIAVVAAVPKVQMVVSVCQVLLWWWHFGCVHAIATLHQERIAKKKTLHIPPWLCGGLFALPCSDSAWEARGGAKVCGCPG